VVYFKRNGKCAWKRVIVREIVKNTLAIAPLSTVMKGTGSIKGGGF
jgi:hypothetical protein